MIKQLESGAYETRARGVWYHLRLDSREQWEVWSRREALGRSNMGTFRHFDSLPQVERAVAAFKGINALVCLQEMAGGAAS